MLQIKSSNSLRAFLVDMVVLVFYTQELKIRIAAVE